MIATRITPRTEDEIYCQKALSLLIGFYSYSDIENYIEGQNQAEDVHFGEVIQNLVNKVGLKSFRSILSEFKEQKANKEVFSDFLFEFSEYTEENSLLSKKRKIDPLLFEDIKGQPKEIEIKKEEKTVEISSIDNDLEEKTGNEHVDEIIISEKKQLDNQKLINRNFEGEDKILNVLYRENLNNDFIHCFVVANINKDLKAYMFCHDRKCRARAYYNIRTKEVEILIGHSKKNERHTYLGIRCKESTFDNITFIKNNPGIIGVEVTKGYRNILRNITVIKNLKHKKKNKNKENNKILELKEDDGNEETRIDSTI